MKTTQHLLFTKDEAQTIYTDLLRVTIELKNQLDAWSDEKAHLLSIQKPVKIEGTKLYVLLGQFTDVPNTPKIIKVPVLMATYLDTLIPEQIYPWRAVKNHIESLGVTFHSPHAYTKFVERYAQSREYKIKVNTKDGRYMSNGRRYLCFLKA